MHHFLLWVVCCCSTLLLNAQTSIAPPRNQLQVQFGLTSGYQYDNAARTTLPGAEALAPVGYSTGFEFLRFQPLADPFYLLYGTGAGLHISRLRFRTSGSFRTGSLPPDRLTRTTAPHFYVKLGGGFRFGVWKGGGFYVDVAAQAGFQPRFSTGISANTSNDMGQTVPIYTVRQAYNKANSLFLVPSAQVRYSRRITPETTWSLGLSFTISDYELSEGTFELFGDRENLFGTFTKNYDTLRLLMGFGF